MSLRLITLEIEQLYGRFNYFLDFDNSDDISIITAPNGFGKTAVISIIFNTLNKRLENLAKYRFRKASLRFSDNTVINISATGQDNFEFIDEDITGFLIETVDQSLGHERWHFDVSDAINFSRRSIERFLPFIQKYPDGYFDSIHEEYVTYSQIIQRYGDDLPPSLRKEVSDSPNFDRITNAIDCHLIATQRLIKPETPDPRKRRSKVESASVVEANAADLASRIEAATREYAAAAQRLDQTFPQRVLRQLPADAPPESEITSRLEELELRREELSRFDLVEKTEGGILGYQPSLKDTAVRNILSLYADDSESKLKTFETLYSKIDLFARICNEHFSFKYLDVNSEAGMSVRDDISRPIDLTSLSSGEQHILVLIYDLLFRVSQNSLILVDEPELSLHVAWQKRFISDLEKIQAIQPMSIVVATHSPQIINDRWDLEIPLEAQQ